MVLWAFGPFSEVVMAFFHSSWRSLAAVAALCLLLLGLGCGGKSDSNNSATTTTITVSGTVTYTRKPLAVDVNGIPTGLETDPAKFVSLPLRGVAVRAFQGKQQTDASGNTVTVWKLVGAANTSSEGKYSISVAPGEPTFLEVASSMAPVSGSAVRVLATSISDSTPLAERLCYLLRKAADGSTPVGDQTPSSTPTANATVDFSIDLAQPWWIGMISNTITQSTVASAPPVTLWTPNLSRESVGTGSRVAAILDTAYTFGSIIGDPTPGNIVSFHYDPLSMDVSPSFVEYNLEAYLPTRNSNTYFGYVRASASNDDAWDEGVILSLLSRNHLVSQKVATLVPTTSLSDRSDLQDLRPEMALVEGFSQAIAATLLKSPYLADTSAGGVSYRDIRLTSGLGSDAYSAANIAAIAWALNLHACGTLNGTVVTPVADTPTGWATLSLAALRRFFSIAPPVDATTSLPTDVGSIYSQIARLQEARGSSDTVDLVAYFPNATLTPLLSPFNITWPRPTSTATLPDPLVPDAGFMANWGADPNSLTTALPGFTLSMASAHRNGLNRYPNFSKGEVFRARFTLSAERIYQLSVSTPSGIPADAQVEVIIDGAKYLFDASTGSARLPALAGNATTPIYHSVQVRLLSPDVLQPDLPITLRLDTIQ